MDKEFTLTIEKDEAFDLFELKPQLWPIVGDVLFQFLTGNEFYQTEIEWDVFESIYLESIEEFKRTAGIQDGDFNDDVLAASAHISDKLHTFLNDLEIKHCTLVNLELLDNGDIFCELQAG